ncbi:MAG: hypothetical protein A2175_01825 [Candidatus Nealsonbacteria bacterium RBG_13_42_11]|uniref:Uncharacterized protein n=1 Tax=Candidatus Nealsonbacteria bacterium RBG_13_42_11 TaxID=1801663 RepID=A0A1G2E089_9BACT|nr:MAG: hypothetical protein A2175_01825 [Candidatus Nealsonbacteria bacterium RBG_13_42_11]
MKTNTEERTERLVERLLEAISDSTTPEIGTLVGHRWPDDDVWLCFFIAKKFIPKVAEAKIIFVNAGETLPGSTHNPSVIHFDTGRGEYDHHGKFSKENGKVPERTCSAMVLAQKLGLNEPGLKPLLELVKAVDNIKLLPKTSVHFAIEGYPRLPEFKKPDGQIDWQKVQERVFELFEIIYNQEKARMRAQDNFKKAEWTTLPNGLKVASILGHPECREAAFEAGAAVVVWTQPKGPNKFYTGIQRNRNFPELRLDKVAVALRFAEAQAREMDVQGKNLTYIGRGEPIFSWYLHDSLGLVLNGSRSWQLTKPEEFTKLLPREIVGLVHEALTAIPSNVISRWDNK